MKEKIESLRDLSHLIMENKDYLHNIDIRGIILDKIESLGSVVQTSIDDAIGEEYIALKSIRSLLNSLIHDLIVNNENPDIGLKMCSDIGLVLAVLDH